MIGWYDEWLKGMGAGLMNEPAVKYWVMGANTWRTGSAWPLPETRWTKFYLSSWERLTTEPPLPADRSSAVSPQPDVFVQMPPTQTLEVARLRYLSDPLPEDVLVAGPISLTFYASTDQEDTNWIVALQDVGP